jgi:hypothetical protein
MSVASDLSPDLLSTVCYTLLCEVRNQHGRRLSVVGVYERAAHAVAALRRLRLRIHSGPVAAIDEEGREFPNGNQIGPLGDPQVPQDLQIGWGYRFRKPDTNSISTIWIKQGLNFSVVTDHRLLRASDIVDWRDFVEESRIDVSDDTTDTNGCANLMGAPMAMSKKSTRAVTRWSIMVRTRMSRTNV